MPGGAASWPCACPAASRQDFSDPNDTDRKTLDDNDGCSPYLPIGQKDSRPAPRNRGCRGLNSLRSISFPASPARSNTITTGPDGSNGTEAGTVKNRHRSHKGSGTGIPQASAKPSARLQKERPRRNEYGPLRAGRYHAAAGTAEPSCRTGDAGPSPISWRKRPAPSPGPTGARSCGKRYSWAARP